MAGVKGRSGTNKGKDKPWTEALRMAALEIGDDGHKKLRAIAAKCVEAAIAGDMQAMREIGDRLDGKPMQSMDMTVRQAIAKELSDDELADIAVGSGEGTAEPPLDPSQLN
jgi:hypothetical protein